MVYLRYFVALMLPLQFLSSAEVETEEKPHPENFEYLGNLDQKCELMALDNDVLCCVHRDGITLFDIANPSQHRKLGELPLPGITAYDLEISNSIAYIAKDHGGLQIIDISDPTQPKWLSNFATKTVRGVVNGIAVSNSTAFISDGQAGLWILDVTNPSNPIQIGRYATSPWVSGMAHFEERVYLVMGMNTRIEIVDVSNPSKPSHLGTIREPNELGIPADSKPLVYSADFSHTLKIVDATEASNPVTLGSYRSDSVILNFVKCEELVYLLLDESGVEVIDISNSASPVRTGHYRMTSSNLWSLEASKDGLVFVNDLKEGVSVLKYSGRKLD